MNERIKELAEQAGMRTVSYEMDEDTYFTETLDVGKFAELIVRECAQLAMTQHHSTGPADYGEMDPYDQGYDDAASTISGLIKRTFRS